MYCKMKYAFWNNKGGVGKSFLSFAVACEYAAEHEDQNVILVDMCPQANLSEIVLGGNGRGAQTLEKILGEKQRKTIGGYFDLRIKNPHGKTGTETNYLTEELHKINRNMPRNLHLIVGDPSLEIQAQAINQISAQTLPKESWSNVHVWLRDLIGAVETHLPNTMFFIDCNPSFASYTEIAMLASDRLIVPCTADGSSARAIDNIGRLLYGIAVPEEYMQANFSSKAKENGLQLPNIHLILLNRSTQYSEKASKAFGLMFTEIRHRADKLAKSKTVFSSPEEKRFMDVPDAHSVSVVCSHEGAPLRGLKAGPHIVHGERVQVNPDQLNKYQESITDLVSRL